MENISGYGLKIVAVFSVSFPAGMVLTQFADDGDPFDIPEITIAESAMGLNGDLIVWAKAAPIPITLNLIPGSDDDLNMQIAFENNRVGKGKAPVGDVVQLTGIYPDGKQITLAEGFIATGQPGNSVASAGRLKTKKYSFMFENKTGNG